MSYIHTSTVPFMTAADIAALETVHKGIAKAHNMVPADDAQKVLKKEINRLNRSLPGFECVLENDAITSITRQGNEWVIKLKIMD